MQERHRLAREIHDGVAQEIASLGYVVDDLTASATSDAQRRKLHSLRGELTRVVSELRLSIFDLRSEFSAGLGTALSDYVREVGARSGITVHMTLASPTRLPGEVETELFRIAQEAITNARSPPAPRTCGSTAGSDLPPRASASGTTAAAWARPARTPTASRSCASARTGSRHRSRSPATGPAIRVRDLRDRYSWAGGRGARVIRRREGS